MSRRKLQNESFSAVLQGEGISRSNNYKVQIRGDLGVLCNFTLCQWYLKSIHQQVFEAIEPLCSKREAGSIAAAYLIDRWHIDRIKLSMNMEFAVDEQLLKSDIRKLAQGVPLQHSRLSGIPWPSFTNEPSCAVH